MPLGCITRRFGGIEHVRHRYVVLVWLNGPLIRS